MPAQRGKRGGVRPKNAARGVATVRRGLAAVAPTPPVAGDIVQLFGRMVDTTGQPAAGVGVTLGYQLQKLNIASTVSDSNGAFVLTYISTSIPPASSLGDGDAPVLFLSVNKNPVLLIKATGTLDLSSLGGAAGSGPASIYGPIHIVTENPAPAGQKNVAPRARLLGDNSMMLAAFKRAPGIFTRPVSANIAGCCGPASPSDMATRVYYLNQFVMFPDPSLPGPQNQAGRNTAAVNFLQRQVAAEPAPPPPLFRYGAMVQFKQEWWDLGFSLGDLLYSIPLAPGEETNIATVDWRRQDYAKRNSTLDESAFQDTTISRDQAIDETVTMHSDKTVSDATIGGGVGFSYGPISIGAAGQYTDMNSIVDATSHASSSINDKIHQASITTRQTRAYSIVETTQQEQATVSTRVLRNHNHCHTVTFQYFEVLRQFRISTKPVSIRPIVFVRFQPSQFTVNEVLRYGYILRRGLIDTTLQPIFDEYLGVSAPQGPAAQAAAGNVAATPVMAYTTFKVTAFGTLATVGTGLGGQAFMLPDLRLVLDDDVVMPTGFPGAGGLTANQITAVDVRFTLPNNGTKQFPGITRIGLQSLDQNGVSPVLDNLEISAVDTTTNTSQLVYFTRSVTLQPERTFIDLVSDSALTTQAGAPGAQAAPAGPDLTRLLNHLNANSAYYTNLIIAAGDAATRYITLANAPYWIADFVDNVVIGTVGNYVAFPFVNWAVAQLKAHISPPDVPFPPEEERLITLPTPGVFAEAQMGSCSACEVIDDTTFWDWQKSPTPENAPDISAAMLASRFQDLSSMTQPTQSTLQPPGVQIPTEPTLPITIGDNTMAGLVSNLNLTNPADVLNLVSGLVSSASQGYKTMVNANQGSPGMSAGGSDGTGAGALGGGGLDGANLIPSDSAMVPADAITAMA